MESLRASAKLFADRVWPLIKSGLGGGSIDPVEGVDTPEARHLDCECGIDWIQRLPDGTCRGLASRVQRTAVVFASFTVRSDLASGRATELGKRVEALETGALSPALTVQANCDATGAVTYVCAVSTDDLFGYVAGLSPEALAERKAGNGRDGNRFVVVYVDELRAAGVRVGEYVRTGTSPIRTPKPAVARGLIGWDQVWG